MFVLALKIYLCLIADDDESGTVPINPTEGINVEIQDEKDNSRGNLEDTSNASPNRNFITTYIYFLCLDVFTQSNYF